MPNRVITSPDVLKPASPNTGSWSNALEILPQARTIVTGGIAGVRPDGTFPGDVAGQTVQMFRNLQSILDAGGMSIDDVVRLTTYLIDIGDYGAYNIARQPFFESGNRPAVTLVAVAALPRPGIRVEIEVMAAK